MIAGFDHLSMSITDTVSETERMMKNGYKSIFIVKQVHNHKEKMELTERFEPFHDLVYLEHSNGFRIEMTKYSPVKGSTEAAYHVDTANPGIITLQSAKFEEDLEFLKKGFHFREIDQNEHEAQLFFSAPVVKWSCRLNVVRNNRAPERSWLDSSGFPCLAFITTSILKDTEKLCNFGALDMTDPFSLTLNGKSLTIVMFRLPGGAIGEIFEIDKQSFHSNKTDEQYRKVDSGLVP